MLDADIDVPVFDPPDAERMYRHCLKTFRQSNLAPASRERASGLMAEWGNALSGRL